LYSTNHINCHSPTQPQLELELDLIMGRNPPHHPTTRNFSGTSRQPRKLIFGMQPYFNPTRKKTSKKEKEDDLKKN
jgi:hypothetical protein